MILISGRCVVRKAHPTNRLAYGAIPWLLQSRLNSVFNSIIEFMPATVEELDAVIRHRIVRCGDHHPKIGIEGVGQIGNSGCRHNSEKGDINPSTCETGDDRSLKELTAGPAISAHDSGRPMAGECAHICEHMRRRNGQIQSDLRSQIAIRQASYPVGTE